MTRKPRLASAAALVLAFAATWAILDRTEGRPGWLAVEAPEFAVVGRRLEIRVTLKPSVETTMVDCTLHHANAERKGWGYLASSGPSRQAVGGGIYSFVFEVPEYKDMAFAFAIVYLSPTGNWQNGTRAVSTKYMPVRRDGPTAESARLKKIPIYRFPTAAESERAKAAGPRPRRQPSPWIHPVLAIFLLASAAFCLAKAGRRNPDAGPDEAKERTVWLLFAAVLTLSAAAEVSGFVGHISSWARRLAQEEHLYEARKTYQKAIMSAMAAAALGLFFLFIKAMRRPGSHRPLWWAGIGLAAYLSVSFAGVLSFHAVDVLRDMTWMGISAVDAARAAGVLMTFSAAALSLRRKKDQTTT
jgi:hypothetical protein